MKKIYYFLIFFWLIGQFLSPAVRAQVSVSLSVEMMKPAGTDLYFDVFLATSAGSAGDLFLGNADLVLTFNTAYFNNPVLTKEGSGTAFCTFLPGNPADSNFARQLYSINTSPVILGNELVINLNGPTPSGQAEFNSGVAVINSAPETHRLGRFRLSGLTDPNAVTGLQWKKDGAGVTTRVFTLEPAPPFVSVQIATDSLTLADPVTVSAKDLPSESSDLLLYPGLASSVINISLKNATGENADVSIFDVGGRRVMMQKSVSLLTPVEVDVRQLQQGVYLVKVERRGKAYFKRFIKF